MSGLVPLSKITERKLQALTWVEPKQVLINLRSLELNLSPDIDEKVRRLRTNDLKIWREGRTAALFAYGISEQVLQKPTLVAKTEEKDFDFVMRWADGGVDCFFPVQLKELPPEDLNPAVAIDDILSGLSKYSGTDDLSVVVAINRRMRFEYRPWTGAAKPKIRELWYFGCVSKDQSRWFLYGSALRNDARYYEFDYPTGTPNVA
jgi:hypothetical protein